MNQINRRGFVSVGVASAISLGLGASQVKKPGAKRPLVLAPPNGMSTVEKVMDRLKAGADPLDAAIEGVAEVESDPRDHSVGYGGIPNAEGVIEVDALVMHGPLHDSGAVAAMRNTLHPASVARAVMQRTRNCLLVGEGAEKFARSCGFPQSELLTDETRKIWTNWKKATGLAREGQAVPAEVQHELSEAYSRLSWYGSIYCLALDTHGDLAGLTTSPGLPFKIPGRVGDTPILGGGLFLDNEVGGCVSTGTGEINLLNSSSFMVVDNLRRGMGIKDACVDACKRIKKNISRNRRFSDGAGRLTAGVRFYCITRDGKFGGVSMGAPSSIVIHDGEAARLVEIEGVEV